MNANTVARARALHTEAESLRAVTRSLVEKHGPSMDTALIDRATDVLDHIARSITSRDAWEKIVTDVASQQTKWDTLRRWELYRAARARNLVRDKGGA